MTYSLFLDDLRLPTSDLKDVKVAKTSEQAIRLVKEHGCPGVISFDYHLGIDKFTSKKFMIWLFDQHYLETMDMNKIEKIIIHSGDSIGAEELKEMWDGFSMCDLTSGVMATISARYD